MPYSIRSCTSYAAEDACRIGRCSVNLPWTTHCSPISRAENPLYPTSGGRRRRSWPGLDWGTLPHQRRLQRHCPSQRRCRTQHAELPAATPHPPDAERRQLTVLFCDLVDSTALSSQLDPEDLREVGARPTRPPVPRSSSALTGILPQYLGDGLLVYFGYPQAHEDDAQRAVHTGLGIVEALDTLNSRLGQGAGGPPGGPRGDPHRG